MRIKLAISTLFVLVGAACSDDTQADPSPGATIYGLVEANPNFTALKAAIDRAGLVDTLNGPGKFTVFAPTDAAFTEAGITDVTTLTPAELEAVLRYHVLASEVRAAAVPTGPVASLGGLSLFTRLDGTAVTINGGNAKPGGANVTEADLLADNGVVHVIDRVVQAPNIPQAAELAGLDGLLTAVNTAEAISPTESVASVLAGTGPFTVFAPTNEAFTSLTGPPPSAAALRDVLLYHVVGAEVLEAQLATTPLADSSLVNAYGNPVTLLLSTTPAAKVNESNIVQTDIRVANGVIHLIDAVLLPPNAVDAARIAGLTSLLATVGQAAPIPGGETIAEALARQAPYTIFAPTNDAFTRVPTTPTPTAEQLRDVLLLHVVNAGAPVLSTTLPATATTELGADLTLDATALTVTGPGGTTEVSGGAANLGPVDINVTNGVVHVISEVLLPAP